jgi:hypothetical protein
MVAAADTSKSTFYDKHHKLVAAWVPMRDYEALHRLAKANKVSLAAYLRAIIVDAIDEETCIAQSSAHVIHQVV